MNTPTLQALRATLVEAWRSRDADSRADLLGAAIDAGAATHFAALAADATGDEIAALCLLARSFPRHVPLPLVRAWQGAAEAQVRMAVIRTIALRAVDADVLAVVRDGVADPDPSVRIATIRVVRENGDAALAALLAPLSGDVDEAVQRWYAGK